MYLLLASKRARPAWQNHISETELRRWHVCQAARMQSGVAQNTPASVTALSNISDATTDTMLYTVGSGICTATLGSLFALSHCHFPKPSEACKDVTCPCHSFETLACWMACITVKEQVSIRATVMSKLASRLFWRRWFGARAETCTQDNAWERTSRCKQQIPEHECTGGRRAKSTYICTEVTSYSCPKFLHSGVHAKLCLLHHACYAPL